MAITEYPAVGTHVHAKWTHPFDASQTEVCEGIIVPMAEPLTHPAPEGAGLSEDEAEFLIAIGALDYRVAVKIVEGTLERTGQEALEADGVLSSTYAQYAFEDVTILD